MEIIGIIILIVVLLAFLAAGIWILWAMNTPNYPKGKRQTVKNDQLKKTSDHFEFIVDVIYDGIDIPLAHLAIQCLLVVEAVAKAWPDQSYARKKLKHTVVWFIDDDKFSPRGVDPNKAAATIDKCLMKFGNTYYPMATIKASYVDNVNKHGEPLIHELCHAVLDEYKVDLIMGSHYQTDIWSKFESQRNLTVQSKARLLYKKTK
jgi:hypothetical protein